MNFNSLLDIIYFPENRHENTLFTSEHILKDWSFSYYFKKNNLSSLRFMFCSSDLETYSNNLKEVLNYITSYSDIDEEILIMILVDQVFNRRTIRLFKEDSIVFKKNKIFIERPKNVAQYLDKTINFNKLKIALEFDLFEKYKLKNVRNVIVLNKQLGLHINEEIIKITKRFQESNNINYFLEDWTALNQLISKYTDSLVL